MFSTTPISVAWFRERVSGSIQRRTWRQRLGIVVVLAAVVATWWYGSQLRPATALALGTAWLLALVAYLRQRRVKVFGPVCFHDLVRTGRRARYNLIRSAYVLVLLGTLSISYAGWFTARGGSLMDLFGGGSLEGHEMARFAESFFFSFAWVQFLAAVLLTPVYVASSLTEEKERQTLEGVLASDLEDQEIILGKLASRLVHLLLVLLAGLPVLAFLQLFGGVDPELVLACFLFTAVTVIGLAALSILCSVHAPRTVNAVVGTYFWMGAFLAGSLILRWATFAVNRIFDFISPLVGVPPWLYFSTYNFGNPLLVMYDLDVAVNSWSQSLYPSLIEVSTEYAVFQGLFTLFCCYKAVRQLRVIALKPVVPTPLWRRSGVEFPPRLQRPKLGKWPPLLWKEIHADAPIGSARFSALVMYLHMILGWCLAVVFFAYVMFGLGLMSEDFAWGIFRAEVNTWLRAVGPFLAAVMLLTVALYAAGSISRERERHTLDGLLTLPVDRTDILQAKWLGTPFTVRPLWWCLGLMWGVGLLTGGLHVLALPLLVASWWVYAGFLTGLGLCFSLSQRSTLRATVWTLFTIFASVVALRMVANNSTLFLSSWLPNGVAGELQRWLDYGLMPPYALSVFSFSYDDLLQERGATSPAKFRAALVGLLCYAAATGGLWAWNRRRFRQLTEAVGA